VPQVPVYGGQQVRDAGLPGARVSTDAPAEAFGGGRAAQATSEASQGLLSQAHSIAQEEKQKADQLAFMSADKAASELQTQIQVQTSQMRGRDALGAPDLVQKQWQDGVKNIQDGLSNDAQKMAFARSVNSRYEDLNKHVQVHVADQMHAFAEQETQGYLESSRSAATANAFDDQAVAKEIARQNAVINENAVRNGYATGADGQPSAILKSKLDQALSQTHHDVILARLDANQPGNVEAAQKYFDEHKSQMTGETQVSAAKAIDRADTQYLGNKMWNEVQGFKLSDGTPDEGKMEAHIMASDDLNDQKKAKIINYIKARSGEEIANRNRADSANDRSFMNDAIDARKQGQSMDDALKLVQKYGRDDYDQTLKADAIKKIYAPPSESDPATYVQTWERIQNGNASKKDIDEAFQNNKINASDWRKLREDWYKGEIEGHSPAMKDAMQRVNLLAETQFGSDKKSKDGFLYALHSEVAGKSPEEMIKAAQDKLKTAPGSGIFGSDWFGTAQWKTDINRLDAQNTAWGKLHADVGKQETTAIGQGVLYAGKDKWGMADVDSFAKQFGGYESIKQGTPANNAIQSLMNRKQLVTPGNVKAVLERYKDGKF
jgi:hypothetical protein